MHARQDQTWPHLAADLQMLTAVLYRLDAGVKTAAAARASHSDTGALFDVVVVVDISTAALEEIK